MTTPGKVPPVSPTLLRFFRRVVRSYFRQHFRSVMLQETEGLVLNSEPLVIYANHSSWWDPMVCVLLAEMLMPKRSHYAPMDATALSQYPLLAKLGIFPVELKSTRGAAQFLRTSQAILESGGVLWITPQGRFADPREPVVFKAGLGTLIAKFPGLSVLPLAIEYSFWSERLPETLLRVGTVQKLQPGMTVETITAILERSLTDTMSELKEAVIARDPSKFQILLEGGRGTGGFYALGQHLRAVFRRRPMNPDHIPRPNDTRRKTDSRSR